MSLYIISNYERKLIDRNHADYLPTDSKKKKNVDI